MISPKTSEELTELLNRQDRLVLFFTADWCPDCQFIYPVMPDIEAENEQLTFVAINRDDFMEVAQEWNVFGIPSFIVIEQGQEVGRFVSKLRKTKAEINQFLAEYNKAEKDQ
ncbi:thioredoxin family protein [Streptococcus pseudoporcinus]|uniref:Hydrogenase-1 expression protein HyaE n=2 Tax=Streptococcus pseudoporcinus TaxID=361101 RepID=G5K9Z9_9STRE|nr:thioredoxin family protein [Streptococcus pseudoporcinus]EFR43518.1 thioredoxin [Streptococcus pseudoporcinus SPIN 20026]EHI64549.1 hydrogenase-1 expression protein HyaE [Streptococcus pseudoporcinus LQ 940-04]VEF93741.1 thioredoxin [Streptococcus pseudoporcinus]VTS13474.1 thioredoxin [Streptococcus pseudoporcinus]